MKKTYLQKGFTLIELLVVIAIIGILSSIVLASLSTARSKGKDAAIQSQLSSMRAQSELYSGAGGVFGGGANNVATCATTGGTIFDTANNGLGNLFNGLTLAGSGCSSSGNGIPSNGATWAVAFPLATTGTWCVDSTGVSRKATAANAPYTTVSSAISNATSYCQ